MSTPEGRPTASETADACLKLSPEDLLVIPGILPTFDCMGAGVNAAGACQRQHMGRGQAMQKELPVAQHRTLCRSAIAMYAAAISTTAATRSSRKPTLQRP